ncbi:MAG: DUF87 domain-containing protein [Candidatus Jordarchaeales archaeon]
MTLWSNYVYGALIITLLTFCVLYVRARKTYVGSFSKGVYYKHFKWVLAAALKVAYLPIQTAHKGDKGGEQQFFHHFQHFVSMWQEIDEASYELKVTGKEVAVFFHIFGKSLSLSRAAKKLKKNILSVKTSLETRFPGLVLSPITSDEVKEVFKLHHGRPVSAKKKILNVKLPDGEKKICVLMLTKNVDQFHGGISQIDMLARSLIQLDANVSFVVCFKPIKKKFLLKHNKDDQVQAEKATGLWNTSCYVLLELTNDDELELKVLRLKNILSTVFSGPTEKPEIKVLRGRTLKRKYYTLSMRGFLGKSFEITSIKLSALTALPGKGVPGLNLRVKPEFNIPPEKLLQGDGVRVGYVVFEDKKLFPFNLKLEQLRKGVAVLGAIGSGKTRMVMKIAKDVIANHKIPVLIFESKGEFASLIKELPPDVLAKTIILRPGSPYAPLKINLFDPGDMIPEEYARRLFGLLSAIFRSLFREDSELTVQMARVLNEVLFETLRREETRSIEGFLRVLKEYAKRETQIPNVLSTINALEARMNIFLRGILGEIFNTKKSNVNIEDLLGNMTIIDFSYLFSNGGSKEDAQLIMNLVMLHVFQAGLKRMNVNTLSHLVIVDDARFLIPEVFVRRSTSDTTAIEDMITLERGKGQGLILVCQDPSVSRIALANCNTRIIFRLSFKSQSEEEFIRMSLNLPEEQREFLLTQPNRSAIVKIPEFPHPFPIVTEEYDIIEVPPTVIERHNKTYHPYLFGEEEIDVDKFLEWMVSVGPVTFEDVARQMKISMSNAIRTIRELERKGYVTTMENGLIFIRDSYKTGGLHSS